MQKFKQQKKAKLKEKKREYEPYYRLEYPKFDW